MPTYLPALAARAALVATLTTTAAIAAVLPAATAAGAPAAASTHSAAPVASTARPVAFLPPVPASPPVAAAVAPVALSTTTASSALQSALAKVGSPYRWGAAGPSSFDCSGLVKWSFARIGVDLPRTSRAQSTVGTAVARSDLRPGDLVFFYSPVSHVAIYIGDGKVVHASSRRSPVKISSLAGMPFHNARRI